MKPKLTTVLETIVSGHAVSVQMATDGILLLRVAAQAALEEYHSYAIAENSWTPVHTTLTQEDGATIIRTQSLEIRIRLQPFTVDVRDIGGRLRFATIGGALEFTESGGVALSFLLDDGECIYGMGEMGDTFEKRGRSYTFWNTDDPGHHPRQNYYCQFPFTLHLDEDGATPYALFADNPGKTFFDAGQEDRSVACVETACGDLNLWLLVGDTVPGVIEEWTALTGRMERPPMWALGYHQCRWSYYPEERVRQIASEFRNRQIPCDVIYLDIDYMQGYRVFTWDEERFPDPQKMISDLREDGFRVVTIVDPGVKIDDKYHVYNDFMKRPGYFCTDTETKLPFNGPVWPGETHFPDFTREDVRALWGEHQKKALLDMGIAGIWNDMNEPAVFTATTFPDSVVQEDFGLRRNHNRIHQIYGLTMARASHDGMATARPNERPFVITRSGYAGVQRYAMVWTGDNQSIWPNMSFDLMLNLGMGLSGISMVGCDIGGFTLEPTPELYSRWIEWGVFQPFARTHSAAGTPDQEPWSFGGRVESIARRMIEWRMRLLPYLYTAFVKSSQTGEPVNRPLLFDYADDPATHRIADQFLFGEDILVAPILQPGADRRMVYLPRGDWYLLWDDEKFQGEDWYIVDAPAGEPPVFVRAGAVIPMYHSRLHTSAPGLEEMFLEIYAGPDLAGKLIEDDGSSLAYRDGVESRIKFRGICTPRTMELRISAPQGPYRSPRESWRVWVHGLENTPSRATANGSEIPFTWHDAILEFQLPEAGKEMHVVVELKEEE